MYQLANNISAYAPCGVVSSGSLFKGLKNCLSKESMFHIKVKIICSFHECMQNFSVQKLSMCRKSSMFDGLGYYLSKETIILHFKVKNKRFASEMYVKFFCTKTDHI